MQQRLGKSHHLGWFELPLRAEQSRGGAAPALGLECAQSFDRLRLPLRTHLLHADNPLFNQGDGGLPSPPQSADGSRTNLVVAAEVMQLLGNRLGYPTRNSDVNFIEDKSRDGINLRETSLEREQESAHLSPRGGFG